MANNNGPTRTRMPDMAATDRGGYCGALQRTPPAMPAGLARRLANKENYGMGKVRVLCQPLPLLLLVKSTPYNNNEE